LYGEKVGEIGGKGKGYGVGDMEKASGIISQGEGIRHYQKYCTR